MSAIPLHIQRRFEQRWASRFASSVASNVSKDVGTKPHTIKINWSPRRAAKTEEKPAGVKSATSVVRNMRARSDGPALRRDIVRIVRALDHG
jgi:hypothetical protein